MTLVNGPDSQATLPHGSANHAGRKLRPHMETIKIEISSFVDLRGYTRSTQLAGIHPYPRSKGQISCTPK